MRTSNLIAALLQLRKETLFIPGLAALVHLAHFEEPFAQDSYSTSVGSIRNTLAKNSVPSVFFRY